MACPPDDTNPNGQENDDCTNSDNPDKTKCCPVLQVEVIIAKAPSNIKLTPEEYDLDGGEYKFEQNNPNVNITSVTISCVAEAARPAPDFTWTIGQLDLVTSPFK